MFTIEIIAWSSSHLGLFLFSLLLFTLGSYLKLVPLNCFINEPFKWTFGRWVCLEHLEDADVPQSDELDKECKCFGASRQDFFLRCSGRVSRASALLLENDRKLLNLVRATIKKQKKKNKVGRWHAGVIIQLVDAENYGNINASPGSHHKHCDEAKTEVPADCLEFTQMIWRCHLGIGPALRYVWGKPAMMNRGIHGALALRHLLFLLWYLWWNVLFSNSGTMTHGLELRID